MALEWLQSVGSLTLTTINYTWDNIPSVRIPVSDISFGDLGISSLSVPIDYKQYIDDDNDFYIFIRGTEINRLTYGIHLPSGQTIASTQSGGSSTPYKYFWGFMVDHSVQEARVVLFQLTSVWSPKWQTTKYYQNEQELYTALMNTPVPPQYTWQSVSSISGKNGILQSLVQIKDSAINDGEPVSEATVLSFDSLGNINIPSVIDEQMPVDPDNTTSATATYLIPALEYGSYSALKLLVKKDSIPTSEEDADKVVDIDEPTNILRIGSKSVANLDEASHYYFVVKVIDEIGTEASSEPKDITTGFIPGIFKTIITIQKQT